MITPGLLPENHAHRFALTTTLPAVHDQTHTTKAQVAATNA